MKATPARRKTIVLVLLILALAGAALREWADDPSITRDIGTLLLVLWLPIIGNVVASVIKRVHDARLRARVTGFAPDAPFIAHVTAEVQPAATATLLSSQERNCTLVLGQEGFTARGSTPLLQWLASGDARTVLLQLLRPELAMPRLTAGTTFAIVVGTSLVATGQVAAPDAGAAAAR